MNLIDAIKDAEMSISKILTSDMSLNMQREMIELNNYAEGAHPASVDYAVAMAYDRALNQFDADHPEIIAEITAEKEAKRNAGKKAYDEYASTPEGANKILSM